MIETWWGRSLVASRREPRGICGAEVRVLLLSRIAAADGACCRSRGSMRVRGSGFQGLDTRARIGDGGVLRGPRDSRDLGRARISSFRRERCDDRLPLN